MVPRRTRSASPGRRRLLPHVRARGDIEMPSRNRCRFLIVMSVLVAEALSGPRVSAATVWHVATGGNAADSNPGTAERPVATVAKAVSLAKPGDTILFSPGTYPCSAVTVPDGSPDLPI